ncbi:hypothetical protein [Staphylococcus pseudintermedius]|uniref:hypothetical protein n=1 Tax=Staphylococcus pseudintermedius TaxID=283734 RepID=UPI000C1BDFB1|nr:hypothetical protein [Staphylococcus pseudintermedius]
MSDKNYININDVKKNWYLDYNNQMSTIANLIKIEYRKYLANPKTYDGKGFDFKKFLESCSGMQPQLIPYSSLTEIIFKNDMKKELLENDEINESTFAEISESRFELFIVKYFNISDEIRESWNKDSYLDEDKLLYSDDDSYQLNSELIDGYKDKIIICFKIIEHIKLAISQKEGLYVKQKIEINELTKTISETKEVYDNMVSNYISILGIFAAILMTAFGGIQVFTGLFNNNKFNLIDSIFLSSFGFMGVILLIFMLVNSIAKLTGKNLSSSHADDRWYFRHPTLINSFIILSSIIFFLTFWKVIKNINQLNLSYFWLLIPLFYTIVMFIIFNRKSKNKSR